MLKADPVDYFWFWTPERPIDPASTQADLLVAVEAARKTYSAHAVCRSARHTACAEYMNDRPPLKLAVCGWGWIARNFQRLHQSLPKEMAFSCINEGLGHAPVTPGFAALGDRPHWAIPWLEDDTPMTLPQLWVGRVRKDAADALRYGCSGLMGIHWRTRVIGPNLAALAQAGWSQQGWSGPPRAAEPAADLAAAGGQPADFPTSTILGAGANARVYQTCRLGNLAYRLDMPDGTYNVTLMFAELQYDAPGKRVFNVKINGKTVLDKLDIFAAAGKDRALDRTFRAIAVKGGKLAIDLLPRMDKPLLAGIVIDGMAAATPDNAAYPCTRKIDCGGAGVGDFEPEIVSPSAAVRMLGCDDFYADWCRAQFGERAAPQAAAIFTACDGRLPRCAVWAGNGPGAVGPPDSRPWSVVEKEFAFVDQFAALRGGVSGPGNLERFDYWADQFRFLRAMAKVRCARGELDRAMAELAKKNSPLPPAVGHHVGHHVPMVVVNRMGEGQGVRAALAARRNLIQAWAEMMTCLLQTVSTPGELGTVANLELHSRIGMNMLARHDAALEKALGGKLALPSSYAGQPRLTVLSARTLAARGEGLAIKILALDRQPMRRVELQVRPMGPGPWQTVPATHVARAVWRVQLPPAAEDFEYFVVARTEDGRALHWPPTAPEMNQTVVVGP